MNTLLGFLLKTYNRLSKYTILNKYWWKFYRFCIERFKNKPAMVMIHSNKTLMPFNYSYPLYSRIFPALNNPLIECVYQIASHSETNGGGGVIMFDVGAAIGDTVLLIKSNCPGMVSKFYCIEGDIEFFKYLTANMECFNDVECINTLLSDSQAPINSLVRTHSGTASAQGNTKQDALMLDTIIEQLHIEALHLLKIDTDGYDGKILTGAAKTLDKFHPVVIFEWHPILCGQVGTDYKEPFKRLSDFGYTTFIWYTKKGNWSHFTFQTTDEYLNQFAEICQKATFDSDWHYDIVALHNTSKLSILEFANSDYSRKKQSPF